MGNVSIATRPGISAMVPQLLESVICSDVFAKCETDDDRQWCLSPWSANGRAASAYGGTPTWPFRPKVERTETQLNDERVELKRSVFTTAPASSSLGVMRDHCPPLAP